MKGFLLIISGIIIIGSCSLKKESKLEQALKQQLNEIIISGDIPGVSFCAIFNDGKIYNLAAGVSDLENQTSMIPHALMFSGSVGKTYVAAITLKLIENGKLNLSDSVNQFFESEPWFDSIPNAHNITIEMLLNHTTGIPRYVFDPQIWETLNKTPDKIWTGYERLTFVFNKDSIHEAGQNWAYSDTNYIILGMIIEKITQQDYYEILKNEIIEKFELNNTIPAITRTIPGLIPGYTGLSRKFRLPLKVTEQSEYAFNPQLEWTGGGLVSNTLDLAKWTKILYEGKFLSQNTMKKMTAPLPFPTKLQGNARYGLGTFIWTENNQPVYGHTGFAPGYITIIQYIPKYKLALAMQFNTDKSPDGQSHYNYLNQVKEIIYEYI